jgi:hypothetical protein
VSGLGQRRLTGTHGCLPAFSDRGGTLPERVIVAIDHVREQLNT